MEFRPITTWTLEVWLGDNIVAYIHDWKYDATIKPIWGDEVVTKQQIKDAFAEWLLTEPRGM